MDFRNSALSGGLSELTEKHTWGAFVHRKHPRYIAPWKIVIVYKKFGAHQAHSGIVSDLSLGGASFFADIKIFSAEPVVATIEIPIPQHGQKNTVISVKCHILHSVLSSNSGKFRTGIKFINFNDKDKEILTKALSGLVAIEETASATGKRQAR